MKRKKVLKIKQQFIFACFVAYDSFAFAAEMLQTKNYIFGIRAKREHMRKGGEKIYVNWQSLVLIYIPCSSLSC